MRKLLDFIDLKPEENYRLLWGGEKDHGYTYQVRFNPVNGEKYLFNYDKGKPSSVYTFDGAKFLPETEKIREYASLEFQVEFCSKGLVVGCHRISKDDALELVNDILTFYTGLED